jgi:hypothetical protein
MEEEERERIEDLLEAITLAQNPGQVRDGSVLGSSSLSPGVLIHPLNLRL